MLNKVIIIGRLVKDPVLRILPSGSQIVEFLIAYNRRYMVGDEWKEESHFFEVKAYGKLAESLTTRISKGYTVVVEGRLSQDRWTDRDGKVQSRVRIVAESVKIIKKPKVEAEVEELPPREEEFHEEFTEKTFASEEPFTSEEDQLPF